MSTQPNELPELPILPKSPEFESQNQIQNHKSLLDEPWKVVVLAEEPKLPPGVWPAPEPHEAESLPWRVGDVTRLKDDSPRGMMEYIATHSTAWWKEMAQRALRDTEKAERMAREAGWQHGQYWALEVDAEAKQKLLDAEEAKRVREEAARAKEEAEKEAFIERQMELLKKAGRAPRCEYQYTDGRSCRAPQVKGERWCHGHAKTMSYRPEHLEILPMEDEQAVMVNLYRVTNSLLSGRITEKVAGLTLWSIAIGAPGAAKHSPQRSRRAQRKSGKHLPQMNADGRRSERKISRELMRKNTNHPGVTNDKSFRSGVGSGVPGTRNTESNSRENSLKLHRHNSHSRGPSTPPQSRCSLGVRRDDSGRGRGVGAERGDASVAEHTDGNIAVHPSASSRVRESAKPTSFEAQRNEVSGAPDERVKSMKSTDLHTSSQGRHSGDGQYNGA